MGIVILLLRMSSLTFLTTVTQTYPLMENSTQHVSSEVHSTSDGESPTQTYLHSLSSAHPSREHSITTEYQPYFNHSTETQPGELKPIASTFYHQVLLNNITMWTCLRYGEKKQYRTLSMQIFVDHMPLEEPVHIEGAPSSNPSCVIDMIVPEHLTVKVEVVYLISSCDNIRRLHVADHLDTLLDLCQQSTVAGEFSRSSRVTTKITVQNFRNDHSRNTPAFRLHLNLTAVAPSHALEVQHTSRTQGQR